MRKANTGLLSARMQENETLIKNALYHEKLLAEGNSSEKIIQKAKNYLKLEDNVPVTGFWEDIQKLNNVKTNTFIKATSLLYSLKDLNIEDKELEESLNSFVDNLAKEMCSLYELEEEDLFEYELEELK